MGSRQMGTDSEALNSLFPRSVRSRIVDAFSLYVARRIAGRPVNYALTPDGRDSKEGREAGLWINLGALTPSRISDDGQRI